MILDRFHPAVSAWFHATFPAPTEAQAQAWAAIKEGRNTLIAAPTGSGKTLAAFLAAIDDLARQGAMQRLEDKTQVLYISPLKALSNDIQKNLQQPLEGINDQLLELGYLSSAIRSMVRTGDTPTALRTQMLKQPPHILVTTPESAYLLLTSEGGRNLLKSVRTVIVDEIHALIGSKRGSHLALSLERLERLTEGRLTRIGLSATQKPIESVAQFLVGVRSESNQGDLFANISALDSAVQADESIQTAGLHHQATSPDLQLQPCHPWTLDSGNPCRNDATELNSAALAPCHIVNAGHLRQLDLAVELPDTPLEAVLSNEQAKYFYERLAQLIEQHRTTLVFVNTRRMAERLARALSERLGEDLVTSHHGSLAREQRLTAETKLKEGKLKALVATASLELGIDVGDVDLVCQMGTTGSISTFLQRVGRSGHFAGGTPKGRLFPNSRDDLIECLAIIDAIHRHELDVLCIPPKPLDVLAQQIVAMVACEDWEEQALFEAVCRAWPYRDLTHKEFDAVVKMLAEGFNTRRGLRSAYLHRDGIHKKLMARKGARLTAVTCGGAIPDNADYRVILEPAGEFIGTVDEDFAIESMAGDIFQLGNSSWKVLKLEAGVLRVEDAQGQPPSIPFWFGEAPGRTHELSEAVARLRVEIAKHLTASPTPPNAVGLSAATPSPNGGGPGCNAVELVPPSNGGRLGGGRSKGSQSTNLTCPHPNGPLASSPPLGEGALGLNSTALGPGWGGEKSVASQLLDYPHPGLPPMGEGVNSTALPPSSPPMGEGANTGGEQGERLNQTIQWLQTTLNISHSAAEQAVSYIAAAQACLGAMPSFDTVVFERFFDESGGMQFIIHAPFGSRLNRAWGLALRKRFCRGFNFELQAAATENALLLSLSTSHSFPLEDVAKFLNAKTVRDLLVQALLAAPMFNVRWRWNAVCSLALKRFISGKKTQPYLIRMQAEDLVASVFPDQIACFENIVGDRKIPDHPLVYQTIQDCLTEAMDIERLENTLRALETGQIKVVCKDLVEPSPLAAEIVNCRIYNFLDDAPLEERRTRAVASRRFLDPTTASDLGRLDAAAIARVCGEAWIEAESGEDLHDGLNIAGFIALPADQQRGLPEIWQAWFQALCQSGRAAQLKFAESTLWFAAERWPQFRAVYPQNPSDPPLKLPEDLENLQLDPELALVEILRARLAVLGPVTAAGIAAEMGLETATVELALLKLETEGLILRGSFSPVLEGEGAGARGNPLEWCDRRLLARIHHYTLNRLRQEIEPVTTADFLRFLFRWQRVLPGVRGEGPDALAAVLEQLEGFESAAVAWESDLLPSRLKGYDPAWLDALCLSGKYVWTRLTPAQSAIAPVKATPIALLQRRRASAWRSLIPAPPQGLELSGSARAVYQVLQNQGASFFEELAEEAGLLKTQVEMALGELVARGLANSDSFKGLRALLAPEDKKRRFRGINPFGIDEAGRWSLIASIPLTPNHSAAGRGENWSAIQPNVVGLPPPHSGNALELTPSPVGGRPVWGQSNSCEASDLTRPHPNSPLASSPPQGEGTGKLNSTALRGRGELAIEHIAGVLLRRYGVVFRGLLARETTVPPWHELLKVYRKLEARGEIRGGRFVAGHYGEQFALPEAVEGLRAIRKQPDPSEICTVSAADPLNLVGIITPGPKLPALPGNRVLYQAGVPLAILTGKETRWLGDKEKADEWEIKNQLIRRNLPPQLKAYL